MPPIPQFNIEEVAQEVTTMLYQRMLEAGMPEADVQNNASLIFELAKIAGNLIENEPGIEIPNNPNLLPFDYATARQGVELFCEGICHASLKSSAMGVPDELKPQFIQNLAQDVYTQAKQIVASTYGQEMTPDVQFSRAQQVDWINQTAESALMYYVNDHEKTNGPILNPPAPPPALPPTVQEPPQMAPPDPSMPSNEAMMEEGMGEPAPVAPMPASQPPAAARQPEVKGPTQHDKYAAVSLLLSTLRQDLRETVLRQFNEEEKELIRYYGDPENIQRNLDLGCVDHHLQKFKTQLKKGASSLKDRTAASFEALTHRVPQEKLIRCLPKERPFVHTYIAGYYKPAGTEDDEPEAEGTAPAIAAKPLPPKVRDALYQYLSKHVG